MSIVIWPQDLAPSEMEFWHESNALVSRSPLSQAQQVQVRGPGRWRARMTFANRGPAIAARLDALLAEIDGPATEIALFDFRRPVPLGTGAGYGFGASVPTEWPAGTAWPAGTSWPAYAPPPLPRLRLDAAAGADTVATHGWAPSETVLTAGDYIGIGGQLHIVTRDVTTNDGGEATLTLRPRLRFAQAAGLKLATVRPVCVFRMVGAGSANPTVPGRFSAYTMEFEESLPGYPEAVVPLPDDPEQPVEPEIVAVGGIAIGTAGDAGTMYENFQLVWGDDFETFSEFSAYTSGGRWVAVNPELGMLRGPTTSAWGINAGQFVRDPQGRSQGPIGIDPGISVAGSVLSLTNRATTSGEKAILYQDHAADRAGITGTQTEVINQYLDSMPGVLLNASGQWIWEGLFEPSAVAAAVGYWPSIWTAVAAGTGIVHQRGSTNATARWPNGGEVDIEFEKLNGTGDVRAQIAINAADTLGGSNVNTKASGNPASIKKTPNRFVRVAMKRTATALEWWTDFTTEGTMQKVGEITSAGRVEDIYGFHRVIITNWFDQAGSSPWGGGAGFNPAQLPVTNKWAWVRIWYPTTRSDVTAQLPSIAPINLPYDATYSVTFPGVGEMWGRTDVDEQLGFIYEGPDLPGITNRDNGLPGAFGGGAASWNRATRAFSWPLPRDRGGRVWAQFRAKPDAGRAGKVATILHEINVAPAPTADMPGSVTLEYGDPLNIAIPFTAFHSGNLSPHTISVSGLASWMTVSGDGGEDTVTIGGTAPSEASSTVIVITCTNRIGQTTQVTRAVTVQASIGARWFEGNADLAGWFLPDDAGSITFGSGSQVSIIANKVAGAGDLVGGGTASSRVRLTNALNGRAVLRFTATGGGVNGPVVPKFVADAATRISDVVVGSDTPHTYAIVMVPRDTTAFFAATWGRTTDASNYQIKGLIRRGASNPSVRAVSSGTTPTEAAFPPVLAANTAWLVVIRHNGTTVDAWVNSLTAAATAVASDVGSMDTACRFVVGSSYAQSVTPDTFAGNTANWDLAEIVAFDAALDNTDIGSLITDLATFWNITLT